MHAEVEPLDYEAIRLELIALVASNRLMLPGVPEIAQRVRQAAGSADASLARISAVAAQDPTLAAHLIKVSNSVALRRGGEVRSLRTAVARLGARLTSVTATSFSILQMMSAAPDQAARLRALYRHSVEVGERCYALARSHPHLVPEDALLAGLIHDIGVPVVLQHVRGKPELQSQPVLERLLREVHAPVGAALLRAWRFPAHVVDAVKAHEDIWRGSSTDQPDYADLLIAANLLSHRGNRDPLGADAADTVPALARLGLNKTPSLPDDADEDLQRIKEICGVPVV
jgi:putative nucleotidyltransferase with HDIG domain